MYWFITHCYFCYKQTFKNVTLGCLGGEKELKWTIPPWVFKVLKEKKFSFLIETPAFIPKDLIVFLQCQKELNLDSAP